MTGADLIALLKKHPIAALAGLICIASALGLYLRSDVVADARTAFEAKDAEARKIADNLRQAAGLAEQTAAMQDAGRQFEGRLVRAGQLANNLQFFYRLEAETGVKLLDIRQNPIPPPRAGAPRPTYSAVPFVMSIQGSYPQVLSFIRRIETGPHYNRFTNLTVTKSAGAAGEGGPVRGDLLNVALTVEMLGTP